MQCRDIIRRLDELAPRAYACEWDNPGFLAGREEKEIKKVLVALDATDEVVEQAVRERADLLLTHHPLIFKPLKQVNDQNFISRRIVELIQADICHFAMHTNFDIAPGCMADLAAELLGLIPEEPLEITGEEIESAGRPERRAVGVGEPESRAIGVGEPWRRAVGVGRIGRLLEPLSVEALGRRVKEVFGLPFVTVYGMEQVTEPVSRVAISPGSGGSMIGYGIEKQAQVLVTGDIGHHDGIDAAANHMAVIDAGHYGLEHIFIPFMADYVKSMSEGELEVITAAPAFPARVIC